MSSNFRLRDSVLAAKERLAAGREKIHQRHAKGSPGVQVCGATADLLDGVILDLYAAALADLTAPEDELSSQVALVAHGGYGRRDVAPYSDVDLMLLHAPEAARRIPPLAERLMKDVFDSGLMLGQSVRTIEQACQLAAKDATICTSLVESRYLAGSQPLFDKLLQKFRHRLRHRAGGLVRGIVAARQEERQQFGETVYLLEPNLKRSPGGLRDYQLLRWVGFVRYGVVNPDALQLCGAIPKSDQQAVRDAHEFLLRLRNEMHFHAGKSYDVLDRAEQVRLAEALGYPGRQNLLPVEELMREYFRHTNNVSTLVTRFVANAAPGSHWINLLGRLFSHRVEGDFLVGPVHISANRRGLAKLRGNLDEVLRLADLANLYDKRIDHATCEAIRQSAPDMPKGLSAGAVARFLSLLAQPARLGQLLRFLYETGVLENIIPAFEHVRCLIQFNEYHKYTVDEHCLRAVERAADFLAARGPLGEAYRHLKSKRTLHLALLLHDLGKGFAEDHSDVGLRIADETARRLQLPLTEAETLKFLVHKHLMMSHLAFRRDTSDEQLVIKFAVDVGSAEALTMLFVLTCADLAAVGPGVLNDWKIEVLADLYRRTLAHLSGDDTVESAQERLVQQRCAVQGYLGGVPNAAWHEKQLAAYPAAWLQARMPREIAAELRELAELRLNDVIARGRYLPESRAVEFSVRTYESIIPGVFHRLCGALSGKGLEILSAEINTLADGLVLDRFIVRDPDYTDEPPPSRLESVAEALRQSLLSPNVGLPYRKVWRPNAGRDVNALPVLPTQVRIDNGTSDRFTIIDVFTFDRPGLLYSITRTIFELGLSVGVAKIGTYLDQVVDVFYVTDPQGQKVEDEDRLGRIRARLLEEIDSPRRNAEERESAKAGR